MKQRAQIYWNSRLQPCWRHNETHCWVQENGTHASRYACTCLQGASATCPIDAHRIPWCLDHPDFGDSGEVVDVHAARIAQEGEKVGCPVGGEVGWQVVTGPTQIPEILPLPFEGQTAG